MPVKYANYSNAHAQTFCSVKRRNGNSFQLFQKVKILDVDTLDCLLHETNRPFEDFFD